MGKSNFNRESIRLLTWFEISANYAVALEGNFTLVYGTSASSPVVGSIITMINDARIAKGKSPVGT